MKTSDESELPPVHFDCGRIEGNCTHPATDLKDSSVNEPDIFATAFQRRSSQVLPGDVVRGPDFCDEDGKKAFGLIWLNSVIAVGLSVVEREDLGIMLDLDYPLASP